MVNGLLGWLLETWSFQVSKFPWSILYNAEMNEFPCQTVEEGINSFRKVDLRVYILHKDGKFTNQLRSLGRLYLS